MKIGVRRDLCQIHFENPLGQLVFRSSKPIQISVVITPGIEHSTDALAFAPFDHISNGTIFQGFHIPPIQVCFKVQTFLWLVVIIFLLSHVLRHSASYLMEL